MMNIIEFIKNLFNEEYYSHEEMELIRRQNELNRYYYVYMNIFKL